MKRMTFREKFKMCEAKFKARIWDSNSDPFKCLKTGKICSSKNCPIKSHNEREEVEDEV